MPLAVETVNAYFAENTELRTALGLAPGECVEAAFIGRGEHNEHFAFALPQTGEQLVLRVNLVPQPFHENQIAYEFAALQALAPSGVTPLPRYLDASTRWFAHGAAVIGRCAGDELNFNALRPGDLRCAAQLLARIHSVPLSHAASAAIHRPDNPFKELYAECMTRYAPYPTCGFADERVVRWVERLCRLLEPYVQDAELARAPRCLINTEALPSHFLIPAAAAAAAAENTQRTGDFCMHPGFFIDWERPIIGDALQDLTYFISPASTFWDSEYIFTPEATRQFLADYRRAAAGCVNFAGAEKRFEAYRLVMVLRATTWYCRAIARWGADAASRMTPKAARKMQTYLSDDFLEAQLHSPF